jgi:plastocyanin
MFGRRSSQRLKSRTPLSVVVKMRSNTTIIIYIVLGIGAVVGLVFFFPFFLGLTSGYRGSSHAPSPISEISVPVHASKADSPKNFEPSTISVVIGLNNKVRWTNYDFAKISVIADDKSDPDFFNNTHNGTSNQPTLKSSLDSYDAFEYTFSKPGKYGYHCSFHPWMQGVVTVLPAQ